MARRGGRVVARIRSIHPGYAKSEDIAGPTGLSKLARLHFALLWTYCDDEGRGKDSTPLIKAECWPLDDDITPRKVDALMTELEAKGRIVRYAIDGRRYFQVTKWAKWQHPQKKRPSDIPPPEPPPASGSPTVALSTNGDAPTVALSPVVVEGEVEVGEREGEGREASSPPSATSKAVRLPEDFTVTADMRLWAEQEAPNVSLWPETAKFRDYWVAQGGQRGRKLDWEATWRNWIRKASEERQNGLPSAARPTVYR